MQDPATPPIARVLQQPEQNGTLQDLAEAAEQEHNEQQQLEQQHLSLASLQDTLAQPPARVKTCDLRQAAIVDEAGALQWPRCVAGCKWTSRAKPALNSRLELMDMHMKHLTACGHLNGTAHPVHICFEMEGLGVTYVVRPGTGSKGRATYAKLGFQREGEDFMHSPNAKHFPNDVASLLKQRIEGLQQASDAGEAAAAAEGDADALSGSGAEQPATAVRQDVRMLRSQVSPKVLPGLQQAEAQQAAPSMAAAGGQAGSRGRSRLQEGLPAAQAHSLLQLVLKRRAPDTSKVRLPEEEEAFMEAYLKKRRLKKALPAL